MYWVREGAARERGRGGREVRGPAIASPSRASPGQTPPPRPRLHLHLHRADRACVGERGPITLAGRHPRRAARGVVWVLVDIYIWRGGRPATVCPSRSRSRSGGQCVRRDRVGMVAQGKREREGEEDADVRLPLKL
eukprot:scaffold3826_cov407-Prasinococcus_capsulatus_cf.AAC.11